LWRLDAIHYPNPLPLLEHDLHQGYDGAGTVRGLASYNLPMHYLLRNFNGYLYSAIVPASAPPEFVMRLMQGFKRVAPGLVKRMENRAVADMSQKYLVLVEARLQNLHPFWVAEALPAIQALLRRWRSFDLDGAGWAPLLAHLEWTLAANEEAGYWHTLLMVPFLLAMSEFDELYRELFSDVDPFGSHRLLQGYDNCLLQGDRWLWQLGRKALTMPAVQDILERESAAGVLPALRQSATGQVFVEELERFIAEHGHRNSFVAYSARSWHEDPTPVIKMLKDYITQPDRDLATELEAEGIERERRVAEARARLQGYPQPVREQFDRMLATAQTAVVIHNDHAYWLDCACVYEVRRVMLAFGRRLAGAGVIDDAADVMHLTLEELKRLGAGLAQGQPQAGVQALLSARQAELARFATIKPPQQLGTVPWLEPPDSEPMFRAGRKFTGEALGAPAAFRHRAAGEVRGNAGSPGVVRGVAKVARSLAEADKIEPGDVLIAETTAPPWTPLFATVAAVVTDTGGILSHCAVVAREYGIPAVVGAAGATDAFSDGQLVEVDGNRGLVRVV
jgi:pyruvate,water dikinase